MKISYINDLRCFPNWGCRATGVALSELLEMEHTIVNRVGAETGNNSGWNSFSSPMIREGGILPRSLADFGWSYRKCSPKFSKSIKLIDSFFGARYDFVGSDPKKSVLNFMAIKDRYIDLAKIYDGIIEADVVIINGEGTLIFRNPMARDALFLMFIMQLCVDNKKPFFLLNSMLSECPATGYNDKAASTVGVLLSQSSGVGVRDSESFKIAKELAKGVEIRFFPDALFTWREKIELSSNVFKKNTQLGLSFGNEHLYNKFDFSSDYICIAGTSLILNKEKTIASFIELVTKLKSIDIPLLLLQTCIGDKFLEEVSSATQTPLINYTIPVLSGASIVSNAKAFVTGRFHPSIMAACAGVPCIYLGSNSHKNKTLQEVLGYEKITHYSHTPSTEEIQEIHLDVSRILINQSALKEKIKRKVIELDNSAKKVTEFINHIK